MDITYIGEEPPYMAPLTNAPPTYETIFPTARPLSPRKIRKYRGDLSKKPDELIFSSLQEYLSYLYAYKKRAQKSSNTPC